MDELFRVINASNLAFGVRPFRIVFLAAEHREPENRSDP